MGTFVSIADLLGFLLIFKGTLDLIESIASQDVNSVWWLGLIAGLLKLGLGFGLRNSISPRGPPPLALGRVFRPVPRDLLDCVRLPASISQLISIHDVSRAGRFLGQRGCPGPAGELERSSDRAGEARIGPWNWNSSGAETSGRPVELSLNCGTRTCGSGAQEAGIRSWTSSRSACDTSTARKSGQHKLADPSS